MDLYYILKEIYYEALRQERECREIAKLSQSLADELIWQGAADAIHNEATMLYDAMTKIISQEIK